MDARVIRSVLEIDQAQWDALCPDPVFSHGWFRALEAGAVPGIEPRHLILEEGPRIVGILPCVIQSADPYYSLHERLFGPASTLARRIGLHASPALLAYSPLAHRSELFLAPGQHFATAVDLCNRAMQRICEEASLPASGWPFVSHSSPALIQALRASGHNGTFLAPSAYWLNTYRTFDDYLDGLKRRSRHRYKAIKHELNRFDRSGMTLIDAPLHALDDERLASMFQAAYHRHYPGRALPLSPAYFAALKQGLAQQAVVHLASRNGEPISYSIVLKGTNRWHLFISGTATDRREDDPAHFPLNYYFPMRLAIAAQTRRLDYGLAAYAGKVDRGCKLEPVSMFLRFHPARRHTVMAPWLQLVNDHHHRKHRRWTAWYAPVLRTPVASTDKARSITPSLTQRVWNRLVRALFEQHEFILTAMKTDGVPPFDPPPGMQMRQLRDHELSLLRPTASRTRWALFQQFRKEKYRCYGCWKGEQLIGYMWVACAQLHYSALFGRVHLRPDEAFDAYGYVRPQYRGRGISVHAKRYVAAALSKEGIRYFYSGVEISNFASLKSNARIGAWCIRLWKHYRIGPIGWRRSAPLPESHPIVKMFSERRRRMGLPPITASTFGQPETAWNHPLKQIGLGSGFGVQGSRLTRRERPEPTAPSPEPIMILGRLIHTWRTRGMQASLRLLWRKVMGIVGERSTILECLLPFGTSVPLAIRDTRLRLDVRALSPKEIAFLRPHVDGSTYRLFEQFVRERFRCYAAFSDGRLAAYNWYTNHCYTSPVTNITFPVSTGEIFLVYSCTIPSWRGRGVDVRMKQTVFRQLQQEGFHTVRTTAETTNRPSLRIILRWGGLPCRQYHYRRLLWWRRTDIELLPADRRILTRLAGDPGIRRRPHAVPRQQEAVHAGR